VQTLETVTALGPSWLDPNEIVKDFGLIGIALILFAECGLLVGFFLPGDTLLFAAGVLVKKGTFDQPLWFVIAVEAVAAIAGNLVGYEIGRRGGPAVFSRPDSRLFRPEYVDRTRAFFDRYGAPAIILGRFVPVVRTFITVMAGAGRMPFGKYAAYTVVGGVFWVVSVTMLGYFLGDIEFIADNVDLLLVAGVAVSVVPIAGRLVLHRRTSSQSRD
jgi:membrane-associated protein